MWTISPHDDSDPYHYTVTINGPEFTPYAGGIFFLDLIFTFEYPFKAPKICFATKIYHPNIYDGHLCLALLDDEWAPTISLNKSFYFIIVLP